MKSIFRFLWGSLKVFHVTAGSILFAIILILLANAVFKDTAPVVPDGAALIIAPQGVIVEKERSPDPLEYIFGQRDIDEMETSLWRLVRAIDAARDDSRISALVLSLDNMVGAGPAALHLLADSIEAFKESNKPVIAYGDNYDQAQYLIAAHADRLYLNPFGSLNISGYGTYPLYFKSALDKIKANVNVFRVGTYKSAVEPFLRDSMSEEAEEANLAFLGVLWDQYKETIGAQRGIDAATIQSSIDNFDQVLASVAGNFAQFALESGLVDDLRTRQEVREELIKEIGAAQNDYQTFKHISVREYLSAKGVLKTKAKDRVGVIVARGPIVGGYQDEDVIGAETLVGLIRKAREDSNVKALVLRLDTPGGGSFASELIRQELNATRQAGMPVVVSFGTVGASGGYWIATGADEIWAAPTTITGSIGIFGIVPTFENTLDEIGIHSDGIGTTDITGGFSVARPLSDKVRSIIQQSIEFGYQKFLSIVSDNRGMTPDEVDTIAQGRVWAGSTAKDLGLIDGLGDLQSAIDAAAARAELERYDIEWVEEQPDFTDMLLRSLMSSGLARTDLARQLVGRQPGRSILRHNELGQIIDTLMVLEDPQQNYVLCFVCNIR